MPNHVSTHFHISGNQKDIRKFEELFCEKDDNGDYGLSFEKMLPTPKEYLDNDKWYSWRLSNWGTKWDTYERVWTKYFNGTVDGLIWTAWDFPESAFNNMVRIINDNHLDVTISGVFCSEDWRDVSGSFYCDLYCKVDYDDSDAYRALHCEQVWGYNPLENDEYEEDDDE